MAIALYSSFINPIIITLIGKCIPHPSLSGFDILQNSLFDVKFSHRSVTVDTFI